MDKDRSRKALPRSSGRIRRWLRQSLKWLLIALLGLLFVGAGYEAYARSRDARRYPPPGELHDIGGYRLHLNCLGTGRPTVILEPGLGRTSLDWSWVHAEIAQETRVCAYDRAGSGWSDPSETPRDSRTVAVELQRLLLAAKVDGPLLLVGHSIGGSHMQLFQHHYPESVSGMALIDVSHTDRPPSAPPKAAVLVARFLHTFGALRLLGVLNDPHLPAEIQPLERALVYRSHFLATLVAENEAAAECNRQAKAVGGDGVLGHLPLTIVTAAGPLESIPRPSHMSLEDLARDRATRHELQRQMLAMSASSRQIFAARSGHQVHKDEPELVIEAILDLVKTIRGRDVGTSSEAVSISGGS